jgi:hypothetical protein
MTLEARIHRLERTLQPERRLHRRGSWPRAWGRERWSWKWRAGTICGCSSRLVNRHPASQIDRLMPWWSGPRFERTGGIA